MTILYALSADRKQWIPMVHAERMGHLLLKAQLLESQGAVTMFQWGVDYAYFAETRVEPPGLADVPPIGTH